MGITGLLPFLEKASTKGNISQFAGQTVAIDSYCWLHKGAFSCAEKLALGQPTDAYVTYCLRYINMLLAHKIKPILVFDGCHLPAKKDTESKRRELREKSRRRAAELIHIGQVAEGKNLLKRSVDISHEMALSLIKTCHELNVDCIVAPYEADSQLAYLNISGIADVIITEDSDLTLFGCRKIFFKMDVLGNGVLVEQERFHLAMGVRSEHFSMDKFRYMCILSGCDYLPSLPGIGLIKACKFIKKTAETDMHKALTRLPAYLNMKSLDVTKEYRDAFLRADVTFKHQLVFCPLKRKQVRLTPPTPDVTPEQLHYAGKEMPDDLAWQLAIGNYDPMSLKQLHNYDPDNFAPGKSMKRTNSWKTEPVVKHTSIWNGDFKVNGRTLKTDKQTTLWPNTLGKVAVLKTTITRTIISPKRNYEEIENNEPEDMLKLYGNVASENHKRSCTKLDVSKLQLDTSSSEEKEKSPIIIRRANPFAKATKPHEISPSLLDKGRQRTRFRHLIRFRPTRIDDNVLTQSKFFARLSDSSKELSSENCIISPDDIEVEKSNNCSERSDMKNEKVESLNSSDNSASRVEDQQLKNTELNHEIEEKISVDKIEISQEIGIIDESTYISDSTCGESQAEISNALPPVEHRSIPAINSLNNVHDVKQIISALDSEKSITANGLLSNSQTNSVLSNLSMWSNPKINSSKALLSTAAIKNSSNGVGTLRSVQGATKTMRQPRASVNRKFQPVKKRSQVEQGQQCLLSSFGFQKKTGLQH